MKAKAERRKSRRGNLVNYEPPLDTDSDRPKTSDVLVPKADIDFLRQSFRFYDKEK